ncbi:synaptotagmin-3-like [Pyrus x bretschneideri]|uniref:synaptotagmin-3-like n=1 Tax=Pyrus x bretschneideri TaxID=225117 RepID=UPI000510F4EA|nr:synaptotagmin-3-like [Pyrus x bretschneideri]
MRILSLLFDFIGFGFGIPIGLVLGFFIFIYSKPEDVKDPIIKPLDEIDTGSLIDLLHEIPPWVKHPDYERIDWFNKALYDMWPYLDKAICGIIRSATKPIFAEYIGKYQIKSIEFETLTLGSLPPTIYGMRVHETTENELIFEPAIRWAGNPHITVVLKLLPFRFTAQLVDIQIFAAPRIILRPLVPSFPCFANVVVSLIDKPHVDFGLKIQGGDVMAIPGLYQFIQEFIKRQVASLYLWPQTLDIPILDSSLSGTIKKPVGILHVKVVKALKLLKMDIIGTSDPYVKIKLSGERLPSKKTTIKMRNLNPEWNESFRLTVKDPQTQILQFDLYDWEQIGTHDFLGMQIVPLKVLIPHETKELTLDLVKNTNPYDPVNKKGRGHLIVELTYNPFIDDHGNYSGPLDGKVAGEKSHQSKSRKGSKDFSCFSSLEAAGLLSVTVQGAEDVSGKNRSNPNPYALVSFGEETKITKMLRKTQCPSWNEEFQFVIEDASLKEKIHIEVMSKKRFGFRRQESLGYIDINFSDVVYNGRIRGKYNLINSKNGVIHIETQWNST